MHATLLPVVLQVKSAQPQVSMTFWCLWLGSLLQTCPLKSNSTLLLNKLHNLRYYSCFSYQTYVLQYAYHNGLQ